MNHYSFEDQTIYKAMDYELFDLLEAKMPDKFDGKNFSDLATRDATLSHLKLDKYISQDKPINHFGNIGVVVVATEEVWIHGDYMGK